jgi:hypothetical protein
MLSSLSSIFVGHKKFLPDFLLDGVAGTDFHRDFLLEILRKIS